MRVLYILVFLFWSTCSVAAQDLGNLTGKVETGDGEILFGANVVVKGPTIEGTRGAITNEQANLSHRPLAAGHLRNHHQLYRL